MKHSRGALIITSLIGIGLLGATYRSVHTPAETSPAAAKQEIGGAETPQAAELAELRQEMARLKLMVRSQEQRLPVEGPATTAAKEPAGARDPRTDPAARAEDEHKRLEYMAGIDTAFRNETMDPRWSSATLAMLHTVIAGDDELRPLAHAMECRSHTCRLEIADDGTGKLGQIIPMFAQRVGQDLPSIAANRVEDTSGGATMVLYMSRPGDTAMVP